MQDLKIALIQSDLVWEDIAQNLVNFERVLQGVEKDTDVAVLPEMFTTGFSMQPEVFAAQSLDLGLEWMKRMATTFNFVVAGSLMVPDNKVFKNRFFWVEPNGELQFYDKRHLFTMGNEQASYEPGSKPLLITYKSWRIMPIICYDLRFPVWCRNTTDYDLLLVTANWPERRILHWNALLMARAIENQAYVAAVNRVGYDGNGIYHNGSSQIIGPEGTVLQAALHEHAVLYQTLSKTKLDELRLHLPFLNDQDSFELNNS